MASIALNAALAGPRVNLAAQHVMPSQDCFLLPATRSSKHTITTTRFRSSKTALPWTCLLSMWCYPEFTDSLSPGWRV